MCDFGVYTLLQRCVLAAVVDTALSFYLRSESLS